MATTSNGSTLVNTGVNDANVLDGHVSRGDHLPKSVDGPSDRNRYRHIAAVHSRSRTSYLSHDSKVTPSFLGFRNLMVIMLGMFGRVDEE